VAHGCQPADECSLTFGAGVECQADPADLRILAIGVAVARCERENSSPASSIGNVRIAWSSVGPSTPQFHERLFEWPSRLFSPFAALCFSLYVTRSLRVKPSCAVMKLSDERGLRPRRSKKSDDAHSRACPIADGFR